VTDSLVTFYQVLPGVPPQRASDCAAGTLPVRAYRYCEAARAASAFGYYVFLPLSFQIEWDGGTEGLWSIDDGATWYPLTEAAYPDSMAAFDEIAPANCRGYCPPFLTMSESHALLQVWTGLFARTAPGYSLLVRPPANLTRPAGYETLEGIVETDQWFGPLFVALRLVRSNAPISFDRLRPFLQVQPVHRSAYGDAHLNNLAVRDGQAIPAELWDAYEQSLIKPVMHDREKGHYAKTVRKRRAGESACPVRPA
jgi:hypothetical protein